MGTHGRVRSLHGAFRVALLRYDGTVNDRRLPLGEASWFYGRVLLCCVGAPLFLFGYRAVFREGCSVFGAVFFYFRRFVERAVQVRLFICQRKEDESKGEWDA